MAMRRLTSVVGQLVPTQERSALRPQETADARSPTSDTRVTNIRPLIPPACLLEELPCTPEIENFVMKSRQIVSDILSGKDDRVLVVIGPCSIHDPAAAIEYAKKLKPLADAVSKDVYVVMRVYFEKPRTTVGWKGLINDPDLNNTFHINKGLRLARKLMLEINQIGLPVGSELLDTISPQFISDLISWGAIGARTTESQLHRELVSGLSFPVGFKNGTNGDMQVAVDAIMSARTPHCFLGATSQGLAAIVETAGNPDTHIVLRGGSISGPNFSAPFIAKASALCLKSKIQPAIMVDCSHGNSLKDHRNQVKVVDSLAQQLATRDGGVIIGAMVESNLVEGAQKLGSDPRQLKYGQSITDACVALEPTSRAFLQRFAEGVSARRALRRGGQQ